MAPRAPELIEILTDGGAGFGLGHLRRSGALAAVLRQRGHRVRVRARSGEADALLVAAPRDRGPADLVVFDLPYDIAPHLAHARARAVRCVALDHFGADAPDLTISVLERGDPPPGRRLSGTAFAIIRQDVLEARPTHDADAVLVMLGGGDLRAEGRKAVEALARTGEPVWWVHGPLMQLAHDPAPSNVTVERDPADLPRLMATCHWAVANGGVSMLELAFLGTAIHVLPQTEHEMRLAEHFRRHGAVLGIGLEQLAPASDERLATVGAAARRLVDGAGAQRVADEIEALL